MAAFGVVKGDVVANFQLGFGQVRETAAVEQLRLAAALKRLRMRIVVAVAAPAYALLGAVPRD